MPNQLTQPPEWQRLRLNSVCAAVGIAKSTLWKYIAEGKFPKPHAIGSRVRVWEAAEVHAWLEARKAESTSHAA
jgi:prophage regulatory protein